MRLKIKSEEDFWSGLLFTGLGITAIVVSHDYPMGSSMRMGPGYFPVVLSGIMMLFGLILMIKGMRRGEKVTGHWSIRALVILPFSLIIFGVLMTVAGFIPALVVLIFLSAASGREFKASEVALLTVVLVTISWGMFIWGLSLPYPLFIKFW